MRGLGIGAVDEDQRRLLVRENERLDESIADSDVLSSAIERELDRIDADAARADSIFQPLPLLQPSQESTLRRFGNAACRKCCGLCLIGGSLSLLRITQRRTAPPDARVDTGATPSRARRRRHDDRRDHGVDPEDLS